MTMMAQIARASRIRKVRIIFIILTHQDVCWPSPFRFFISLPSFWSDRSRGLFNEASANLTHTVLLCQAWRWNGTWRSKDGWGSTRPRKGLNFPTFASGSWIGSGKHQRSLGSGGAALAVASMAMVRKKATECLVIDLKANTPFTVILQVVKKINKFIYKNPQLDFWPIITH